MFLFGFAAGHGHSGWLRRREAREARRRDKEYDQFCRLQRVEIRLAAALATLRGLQERSDR